MLLRCSEAGGLIGSRYEASAKILSSKVILSASLAPRPKFYISSNRDPLLVQLQTKHAIQLNILPFPSYPGGGMRLLLIRHGETVHNVAGI